jgi:L-ascorbate metabolism protein UlaG (beta-lactamase superfamily)
MLLTKLGHSCVRLTKDSGTIVVDPGVWTEPDALTGANGVLVTHEHADHFDRQAIGAALAADGDLELWSTGPVVDQLAEFGGRVHAVTEGDRFAVAGFDVGVYGQHHAPITPDLPVVANSGFLVDGVVFHPGDSFTIPGANVRTLLVPVSAPWLKFSEAADYIRAVAPDNGYAIHDAVLSEFGLELIRGLLTVAPPPGRIVARLEPGSTVDL